MPFVFLKLAPDFWRPFEHYQQIERGLPSTFFVIPFKGRPGPGPDGRVVATRAVAYQASEIAPEMTSSAAAGHELAVHGIDAWRDAAAGRAEIAELTNVTEQAATGVRMHWLYFAGGSPKLLEDAGFDYDSTYGYNDAVGYRAGTLQVFKLPETENLMELPLEIMDSAMLSPDRMGLTQVAAIALCRDIVADARRFGGAVVVNWHCRSLSPERLWGRAYEELLDELQRDDSAWFATAGNVVNWFRWRRSIQFFSDAASPTVRIVSQGGEAWYTGVLRIHRPGRGGATIEDIPFRGTSERFVTLEKIEAAAPVQVLAKI